MKSKRWQRINENCVHMASLCFFSLLLRRDSGSLWWRPHRVCLAFAGAVMTTARRTLWATGGGKTMTTCTACTCPACTAAAAATAARPPSPPRRTPSATRLSPSTCKTPLLTQEEAAMNQRETWCIIHFQTELRLCTDRLISGFSANGFVSSDQLVLLEKGVFYGAAVGFHLKLS